MRELLITGFVLIGLAFLRFGVPIVVAWLIGRVVKYSEPAPS